VLTPVFLEELNRLAHHLLIGHRGDELGKAGTVTAQRERQHAKPHQVMV